MSDLQSSAKTERASRLRKGMVIATIVVVVVEWLLLELVRIPYSPPRDMLTLLGQEKYAVFGFMFFLFAMWLTFVILVWPLAFVTRRNSISFVALLAGLAVLLGTIVAFPLWTVTPWNLILH